MMATVSLTTKKFIAVIAIFALGSSALSVGLSVMFIAGTAGFEGPKGDTGPQGPEGPQGTSGADGTAGDIGPIGPKGDTGDTGPQGPTGATGATGPIGPQGEPGYLNIYTNESDFSDAIAPTYYNEINSVSCENLCPSLFHIGC